MGLLSPDSGLLVKALIEPGDIGLIKKGMPVRIHVDAVNYRQSDAFKGIVTAISGDVLMQQDRTSRFEVMCALAEPPGAADRPDQASLRRGMQVRARFIVAERSLFQLLGDDINDWLGPYAQGKG